MNQHTGKSRLLTLAACALLLFGGLTARRTQAQTRGPITSEELLQLVRQLPKRPALKEELLREIQQRGINFTLTSGLRAVVATKSGNDVDLRRALEEAERRFLNPEAATPISPAEAEQVLASARTATLAVTEAMPDFVVKQLITRAYALGNTKNWRTADRLTVAVSYRAGQGEQYKLLAVNGFPSANGTDESSNYATTGGTTSTGEFVSILNALFSEESKTEFKPIATDVLRGRRTLVYEFTIKLPNSKQTITYNNERTVSVGSRGRVWIDRELNRVLRIESIATDIPADFPVRASMRRVDYEWVTIPGQGEFLLPSLAVLEMTATVGDRTEQSRNQIRFRNYQKYGTEIRILDEDIIDEEKPEKP